MNKALALLFFVTAFFAFKNGFTQYARLKPLQTATEVLATPQSFSVYYDGLRLWDDFIPLDNEAKRITKLAFLQQVATGNYLPLRMNKQDTICYRLYRCDTSADNMAFVKAFGYTQLNYYKMEGKPLPGFDYTDLNGRKYNQQTMKGKTVVWKCWFIHCAACVAEMPALNSFVDSYKSRNDIVFVSVAFDSAYLLKKFLKQTQFNYAVAPVTEDYIINTVGIREFPTHIVLNKQGLVVKVLQNYEDMEEVVRKMCK